MKEKIGFQRKINNKEKGIHYFNKNNENNENNKLSTRKGTEQAERLSTKI